MSHEAVDQDDQSEEKTFEYYPRLPRELRFMIWEWSLPARHVFPRNRGYLGLLGPPAAAHVCQDSRIIALQFGGPYGLHDEHKRGNSVWFMPRTDIIVYGGKPASFVHRVCGTSVWDAVQRVVVRLPWCGGSGGWPHIERIVRLPQLTEIFIIPTGHQAPVTSLPSTKRWPPHIKSEIFGKNTYRLVDIDDDAEFFSVINLFYDHRNTRHEAFNLFHTREESLKYMLEENLVFRVRANALFQRAWLEERGVPVVILSDGVTVSRTKQVKSALEHMPTIRFVRGYFERTEEISMEDRQVLRYAKNERQAHPPKYVFNHELRLWQKFGGEKAYE